MVGYTIHSTAVYGVYCTAHRTQSVPLLHGNDLYSTVHQYGITRKKVYTGQQGIICVCSY